MKFTANLQSVAKFCLNAWANGLAVLPIPREISISGWSKRLKPVSVELGRAVQLHGLRRGYRTALSEFHVPNDIAEMMIGHHRQGLAAIYDQSELTEERRAAQLKLEHAWMEVIDD